MARTKSPPRTEEWVTSMMRANKNASLLAEVLVPGQHGVRLWKTGPRRFRVQYGELLNTTASEAHAAVEFGGSVMHALRCAGELED